MKLHNLLMRHLFNAITEDSFLRIATTKTLQGQKVSSIIVGRTVLDKDTVREYRDQAKAIAKSGIWNKIIDSMKYTANENLFKKAATSDDMLYARAMLYTLDVLEKKLNNIASIEN